MLTEVDMDRLKEVASATLGVDPEELEPTASPATIESWTSFNHLNLMAAVEDEFGLTLSMEEMSAIKTFSDLETTVSRHVG